jgi:DNA polymerase III alpha subunit
MIQTKRTLKMIKEEKEKDSMKDFFELQDENLWMKSEEEINEKWLESYSDIVPYEIFCEAKKTTVKVCEMAKGVEFDRSLKLPSIDDSDEKLKEAIKIGFSKRMLPKNKKYLDRVKEEYSLITRKGFSSYFLIQKMMTDEARRVCPLIIGGGIKSIEKIHELHSAGANVVVIGNKIEEDVDFLLDIANLQKEKNGAS